MAEPYIEKPTGSAGIITLVPIDIGPALLELANAYDRRTRWLIAQHASDYPLQESEFAALLQKVGLYDFIPASSSSRPDE